MTLQALHRYHDAGMRNCYIKNILFFTVKHFNRFGSRFNRFGSRFEISGDELKKVNNFKYLATVVEENEVMDMEIRHLG